MTDTLDGLRLALGEKSLCFRTEVQNANMQQTTSHTWDNIHKLDTETRKYRSLYHQARSALQWLDIDSAYQETLLNITDDNMKVAGDITDENQFGQWSDTIPGFWRIGEPVGSSGPWMQECRWHSIPGFISTDPVLVYCVSWLRVKAQLSQWEEEVWKVGYEMQWTVNSFRWKAG